ncbi:hypothetical protein Cgig2_018681 [Carnegiea gigantea]|uniref:Uncharacterized protein n=1 Tax=Carnegiea gigantea TaxID=171969 RepID=A0A9Q1GTC0_9CARY|nr:hypothetical protein Cgig2_018681 [Carnegiea gigantea]
MYSTPSPVYKSPSIYSPPVTPIYTSSPLSVHVYPTPSPVYKLPLVYTTPATPIYKSPPPPIYVYPTPSPVYKSPPFYTPPASPIYKSPPPPVHVYPTPSLIYKSPPVYKSPLSPIHEYPTPSSVHKSPLVYTSPPPGLVYQSPPPPVYEHCSDSLSWKTRLQIAIDSAQGLDHAHLSPYLLYISGVVAGCAATIGSYPFDLVRTILASQGEPKVMGICKHKAEPILVNS